MPESILFFGTSFSELLFIDSVFHIMQLDPIHFPLPPYLPLQPPPQNKIKSKRK